MTTTQVAPEPGDVQSREHLSCHDLSVTFGGTKALIEASVTIPVGEIVGLVGPNGAGKSTLINALSGQARPSGGRIEMSESDGTGTHDILRWSPEKRWKHGMVRTFQGMRLFEGLTVYENVLAGALGTSGREFKELRVRAADLLAEFDLSGMAKRMPGEISIGQQKLVGVCRALLSRPRFVLLDEPLAGLSDDEVSSFLDVLVATLRGVTGTLIVEHNLEAVKQVSDSIYVLDHGRVLAHGGEEVFAIPEVEDAYMGGQNKDAFVTKWLGR